MTTGIDAIAFDIAKLHLPVKKLAYVRNIDPEKLEKGLGLENITVPDAHQDSVVFAANALTKLVKESNINPADISRIYVGTESGVDNAKPVGSYLIGLMEQLCGEDTFSHCDTVDFTFACIGAVDALQNCLDYIRLNPDKKAVVISTDIAKYDLGSTGEYTQGAGALAILVSANPKIVAIDTNWAVSTKGVFDFFKPYRSISKWQITGDEGNEPWFGQLESEIELHKDQPVFDGQYSNQCYVERTKQAYFRFKKMVLEQGSLYNRWEALVMHLPYAYQGRRMFAEIFALDAYPTLLNENEPTESYQQKIKEVSKSEVYKDFVKAKLQPAERASSLIGNLYTGSVFMGLLSALVQFTENEILLTDKKIGFLAYGSGSKSKVFEGTLQQGWADAVKSTSLFETLQQSHEIDFDTYLKLHKREKHSPVVKPKEEWVLERIEKEIPNLTGARYYKWEE